MFLTRVCVLKTFVLYIKVVQFIRIGVCYTWTKRALTFDKANGVKEEKVRCKRQKREMGVSCVLVEGGKNMLDMPLGCCDMICFYNAKWWWCDVVC